MTVAEVPESDRIMTTYTDPLRHIDNTVEEIMLNKEVPHRYNVVARVDRLLGADGHSLVVKVCKPCQRRYVLKELSVHCLNIAGDTALPKIRITG